MNFKKLSLIIIILASMMTVFALGCFNPPEDNLCELVFYADNENYETYKIKDLDALNSFVMPQDPVKGGYIFDGWYTDGNIYSNPFDIDNIVITEGSYESFNIFAKWIKTLSTAEEIKTEIPKNWYGNYKLLNDIDMQNAEWAPLEDKENHESFCGIFDGDGHKISNFELAQSNTNMGLFAYNEGIIRNLTLENIDIIYTLELPDLRIGAIAAQNYGIIENCNVIDFDANLTVSEDGQGFINLGGISGFFGIKAVIENCNCYVNFEINTGTNNTSSYINVGGIVGESKGYEELSEQQEQPKISKCYSGGNISFINGNAQHAFIGGLVGFNNSGIDNCHSDVDINATDLNTGYGSEYIGLGGLLGINLEGNITNCFSNSSVFAQYINSSPLYAGGLIALNGGQVENCFATGNISVDYSEFAYGHYDFYVGELISNNSFTFYEKDFVGTRTNSYALDNQAVTILEPADKTEDMNGNYESDDFNNTLPIGAFQGLNYLKEHLFFDEDIWLFEQSKFPKLKSIQYPVN